MDWARLRELVQAKVQLLLAGLFPAPVKLLVPRSAVALLAMVWAWLTARRQGVTPLTP